MIRTLPRVYVEEGEGGGVHQWLNELVDKGDNGVCMYCIVSKWAWAWHGHDDTYGEACGAAGGWAVNHSVSHSSLTHLSVKKKKKNQAFQGFLFGGGGRGPKLPRSPIQPSDMPVMHKVSSPPQASPGGLANAHHLHTQNVA